MPAEHLPWYRPGNSPDTREHRHLQRVVYLLLFAVLASVVAPQGHAAGTGASWQFPSQPRPAPDFTGTTLDGKPLELAQLRGKTVLLHFWASYCRPCLDELPHLQALQQRCDKKQFVIITVAADPEDDEATVRRTIQRLSLTLPVIHANSLAIRQAYAIRFIPTTYLIAADGKLLARLTGMGNWRDPALLKEIRNQGVKCR
jgi:thiol-disulfide isomerase/thioredoxin